MCFFLNFFFFKCLFFSNVFFFQTIFFSFFKYQSKAAYWATRRKELRDVEAAAAERKKKYSNAGMTFTAQAMAANNGSFKAQS